ncbi:MAG: threonine synthase [Thermoprotei archaeon]|nr:MAG: threonine synthase [Thermoprotei archaeon]
MASFKLLCPKCGKEYSLKSKIWKCSCGNFLDILTVIEESVDYFERIKNRIHSMWRYWELLPIDKKYLISIGEGWTPIIAKDYRNITLYFKLDYLNPTGSFKDRGASALISHLTSIGINEIVEDSSGNAGAAIAAYSAAAGIKCRIYVPEKAPKAKILQIRSYGAEVVRVGGNREQVNKEALKAAEKSFYAGHLWNPFFTEGLKTIVYESFEQIGGVDAVIIPVGSGGLALSICKGFKDLLSMGAIEEMPRIYGVQAEGFTAVYQILHPNYKTRKPEKILADGIAVPDPPRKHQIADEIKKTGGDIVVVNNEEIIRALNRLAKWGLFVEPTSATILSAFEKLRDKGILKPKEKVLMPLTGFGLKAADKLLNLIE